MKGRHLILIILLVLIADQALKIYIKTSFPLNTSRQVIGNWFNLYFVENPGMAYGWKFGGNWGKLALMADPFGHGFCLVQFLNRGYDEIATTPPRAPCDC